MAMSTVFERERPIDTITLYCHQTKKTTRAKALQLSFDTINRCMFSFYYNDLLNLPLKFKLMEAETSPSLFLATTL